MFAQARSPSPHGNYGYAVLTANALRTPDRVAVDHRGVELTYGELNDRVNRLAHGLLAQGLRPGDVVACLFGSGLDIAEYYLAMAKIGLVGAALNPFWPDEQIAWAVETAQPAAFLYDPAQADRVAAMERALSGVGRRIVSAGPADGAVITRAALEEGSPTSEPPLGAFDDDPMAIYYSSGTTGVAKGIVHTHRSNLANSGDIWIDLPHDADSVAASSTMLWGAGFPATLGSCLFVGMKTILREDLGPSQFLELVPAEGITHAITRPSFWSALFDQPGSAQADLGTLKSVLLGSEPISSSLMERIVERLPGCAMWSYYGTSEAPFSCFGRVDTGGQSLDASGPARATVAVDVVAADGRSIRGEQGEIRITGPHLMREYLGLPEKTAEVMRDGWFHTGDLGIKDADGVITVRGRADEAMLLEGRWVLPVEVENAAMSVAGAAEAGAVGVEVDGAIRVLVAVRPQSGVALDAGQISQAIVASVGPWAEPWRVVVAQELPHAEEASGPGKLLRREITRLWGPETMVGA